MFSSSCSARFTVAPNDSEWMLRESDFEVKLKMDGCERLQQQPLFADEADSIGDGNYDDDPHSGKGGKRVLLPLFCCVQRHDFPLSFPILQFRTKREERERADRLPTLDMFALQEYCFCWKAAPLNP
jgi:hypothetical protein